MTLSSTLSSPAVLAAGLVKSYPAGRRRPPVRALDGLDLAVDPGTVLALLGPNGAGKSTTAKIVTTLARPDAGTAEVAGLDVVRRAEDVRRLIGLVAQRPASDPMATPRENLVLAGRLQGLSRRAARSRADELLGRFDLAAAGDRLVRTLSGGMARKLDVAIGLVHRPRVLVLDEPTTGLDPQARAELWAEVQRLRREDQVTVLLATHYLDEADRLADRVVILDAGRVVVDGTPDELKGQLRGDALHVELESPDAARAALPLLAAVPGLSGALADERTVHVRAESAARAVPAVLAALQAAALVAPSVTVSRPSLDDVYLRHTGRRFEVAA